MDDTPPERPPDYYHTAWCPAHRQPVQYQAPRSVPVAAVLCPWCGSLHPVGSVLRNQLKGTTQAHACKLAEK